MQKIIRVTSLEVHISMIKLCFEDNQGVDLRKENVVEIHSKDDLVRCY